MIYAPPSSTLGGHTGTIIDVDFDSARSLLASSSSDNTVQIWDLKTGEHLTTLDGFTQSADNVVFDPSGKKLISSDRMGRDGIIRFWDIIAQKQEASIQLEGIISIRDLLIAPNNKLLVASYLHGVQSWNLENYQEPANLLLWDPTLEIRDIALSMDETVLAIASYTDIYIWNIFTGTETNLLTGHMDVVNEVEFNPNGTVLGSASGLPIGDVAHLPDNTIRLWDIKNGNLIAVLASQEPPILCIAFSPDGQFLASGGYDHTVRIWSISTQNQIMELTGHKGTINDVLFTGDGSILISASQDHTIRLWDVRTGEQLAVLRGHTGEVQSLALNPDNTLLASGSRDGTVRIWDISAY